MYTQGAENIVSGAYDSNGVFFPLDSCRQVITKNASGQVTQIDATFGETTWRQTITYGATTNTISFWIKQ